VVNGLRTEGSRVLVAGPGAKESEPDAQDAGVATK
jgi:hypothetical protein